VHRDGEDPERDAQHRKQRASAQFSAIAALLGD
jgi:hypothetical protein